VADASHPSFEVCSFHEKDRLSGPADFATNIT